MTHVDLENITKRFGDIEAVSGIDLTIEDGEFFTIIGPSGCGKTTTLRLIAGLEQPTSGTIRIEDEDVTDVSPQNRDITFVFQDLALFPNMTVKENIGFNLRINDRPQSEIDEKVREAARMVQIEELLDRDVTELSGGQQQRVALARSSVRNPGVFLLDEPLSDLDAKLKIEIRGELQQLHEELDTTMVYVTHSQEEAMTMSDRIAVMNRGHVSQVGTPMELYEYPRNRFVADFIGNPSINFFPTELDESDRALVDGDFRWQPSTDEFERISANRGTGDRVYLGIRPEDVDVVADGSGDLSGHVDYVEPVGATKLVYASVDVGDGRVRAEVGPDEDVSGGDAVSFRLNPGKVHYFDADDQRIDVDERDVDSAPNATPSDEGVV